MATKTPVVDIHSHIFSNTWIQLLQSRTTPPYIDTIANTLVNRPGVSGKPLLANLYDVATKIKFMEQHGIDVSILSLGNPWLDFLTAAEDRAAAGDVSDKINKEMEQMCRQHEGRLYFFATLPMTAGPEAVLQHIATLSSYAHCRGVVMGYAGFGRGIDDPVFTPVLKTLANAELPIFFHPNYGLPSDVFGPCCAQHGQVLPISIGFTTETTTAFTRIYLAQVFDEIPSLQIILPHAGGTLPSLIGRIEACIANDKAWQSRLAAHPHRRTLRDVLRQNVFFDGIAFDKGALCAAVDAVGVDRVMFGTDHPLFPSLRRDGMYDAMMRNKDAAEECYSKASREYQSIMGGNAMCVLKL